MGYFLRFLLITLASVTISSKAGSTPTPNKSLLWRISSKEIKKPSYLFGTIHMICPEDYLWTSAMQKSLNLADVVCFEMDLDDPKLMVQITEGLLDHSGKKLKDYFKETDYETLKRFLADSLDIDIAMFQQMKPVALQTVLGSNVIPCPSPVSYESIIMEDAKKSNKEILGLEKAAEQLDLFDNLPVDSIIKELVDIVTKKDSSENEYRQLVTAYKNQDIQLLYQLIQTSAGNDIDMAGFIDVRNEKWIKRMSEKMEQQSVFFAVGAGHLWGNFGLIKLLRDAGYKVEPVIK